MSELRLPTSRVDCLDLEDLAAFADGGLTGAERRRAVKHLADCERCYDIFADVVQLQDEEEARVQAAGDQESDDHLAAVVVHPRSRYWLWPSIGGALATAALVVLVVAPLVRNDQRPPPEVGWDEHPWLTLRGGAMPGLGPEARAFRLGVRTIDLEVALSAGRPDEAKDHSARLEYLASGLEESTKARDLLRALRARLQAGMAPAGLVRQAERAAGLLEDLAPTPPYFELGRWVEEGRSAVLVGDRRYFESRRASRFLNKLKSFEPSPENTPLPPRRGGNVALSEELADKLDEVRSLIASEPTGDELEQLEIILARIIELAGTR